MHCKCCLSEKPESDFYSSNKSKCKDCVRKATIRNRLNKIDYYRAYDRMRSSMPHRVAARADYAKTDAYRAAHAKANQTWAKAKPERKRAAGHVSKAVRSGKLIPWPACAVPECACKPEAHHADYSRPLDVVWLCDRHHKAVHKMANELMCIAS